MTQQCSSWFSHLATKLSAFFMGKLGWLATVRPAAVGTPMIMALIHQPANWKDWGEKGWKCDGIKPVGGWILTEMRTICTSVATVPCFFRAWVFRLLVFKAWASVQSLSVLSLSVPVKLYQSLNTKRPSQMQIQLVFSRFHTYTTHKVCFSCLFCSGEEENNQNNCLLMIVQPKDWKGLRTWRLKRTEGLKCTRTESSSPVQGLGDWGLDWTVATILTIEF